jgi:hypothetical protein
MALLPIPKAFGSCQQWHHDHRDGGDDDTGEAPFRDFLPEQRGAGFVEDVKRQCDEARTHDS